MIGRRPQRGHLRRQVTGILQDLPAAIEGADGARVDFPISCCKLR